MSAFRKESVTVAGTKVVMHRGGTGTPLLYFHGAGVVMNAQPWMEMLAPHVDLIVPMHPGMGESDVPTWLDGVPDMAMFYATMMKEMGLGGIHLMGTSMGGWIAAELAIIQPERLKTLTLACAAGFDDPSIPKGQTHLWDARETLRNVIYDPKLQEQMIARLPADADAQPQAIKNKETIRKLTSQGRSGPNLPKWLHRVTVPTHIIWGENDKLAPIGYADIYKKYLPQSKMTRFKECGHLPYLEKPKDYVDAITSFIKEVR